jgi:hypothetical protein
MTMFAIRCLLVTAGLVGAAALGGETSPAAAQGGIACAYGPASYQRCCSESYRKSPRLGSSARASSIDACMNRKPAKGKKRG